MLKQFWKHLGLRTSLGSSCQDSESSENQKLISLKLRHDSTVVNGTKRPIHRISSGVPIADVKPPKGITVVGLEAVVLSLKLSTRTVSCKRKRSGSPRKRVGGHTSPLKTIHSGSKASQGLEHPGGIWDLEVAARRAPREGRYNPVNEPHVSEGLLFDKELLFDDGAVRPNDDCETFSGTQSRAWNVLPNPIAALKRREDDMLEEGVTNSSDTGDAKAMAFLELVDSALRISISGKPHKTVPAVRIMHEEDEARLTDVAPALFSPNFLAVSLVL